MQTRTMDRLEEVRRKRLAYLDVGKEGLDPVQQAPPSGNGKRKVVHDLVHQSEESEDDEVVVLLGTKKRKLEMAPENRASENVREDLAACLGAVKNSRFVLCGDDEGCCELVHIQQHDFWSCGYRHCQMLLHAVLSMDKEQTFTERVLFDGKRIVPSVVGLQKHIEIAWQAGFDPEGAQQFMYRLQGTEERIGTTEVASLLRFFRIRTEILAFSGPGASDRLLTFMRNYFVHGMDFALFGKNKDESRHKPLPLYFQWEGHSSVIVGILEQQGQLKLVRLNSSSATDVMVSSLKNRQRWHPYVLLTKASNILSQRNKFELVVIRPEQYPDETTLTAAKLCKHAFQLPPC